MSTVTLTTGSASNTPVVTSPGTNGSSNVTVDTTAAFDALEDELMEIYVYPLVFVMFYMIVGLIGNAIVIYIFLWGWKQTKTTIFILTLAGVDLFSCLFNMPTEVAILWNPLDFNNDVICKISRFTTFIASASSSFVLIAISIDRYLMICRPFLGRELGVQYAKRTCFVAVLLGIITTWPSLIFYGTYVSSEKVKHPHTGDMVSVETKTCLVSNYYVVHNKLPAGFYCFLLGGHVIMFVILTMVYILIGRKLYISTDQGVGENKRHSFKYFGISVISAITGSVPNNPYPESRSGRTSRTVSLDNVNRVDQSPVSLYAQRSLSTPRSSAEIPAAILAEIEDKRHSVPGAGNRKDSDNKETVAKFSNYVANGKVPSSVDKSAIGKKVTNSPTSTGKPTNLKLDVDRRYIRNADSRLNTNRLSSESTNVALTPVTPSTTSSDRYLVPMTPDSVRGILYRSQSIESRARLNRILSDELRHSDVKEFSLRRNTLILRMVTMAFIISFLPYLVIVTLRYSNSDIPSKLSKPEQIVYHIFLRTYFINSMINPFIYGFMNEEFRMKLKQIFCRFCSRGDTQT